MKIDSTSVRIAMVADQLRDVCNAVGLPHALQGRTYGKAADLVLEVLTVGLETSNPGYLCQGYVGCGTVENDEVCHASACQAFNEGYWPSRCATEIYDTMLDCGEGVLYVLELEGVEIVEAAPLPDYVYLPEIP